MQKRTDLPVSLVSAPFTLGSAKASGVPPNRLRRADVAHVSRDLYRPTAGSFELEAAARALSAASPGAWISHVTAARIRSQILPPWLADSTELHLSKPHSLPEVRRRGVIGHSVLASEGEIEFVDGIRISSRSRTWLDMARRLSESELVCMGDELIRVPRAEFEDRTQPFDMLEGLRSLVARHPNLQGVVRARAAIERMRVGADSAPESLLRLAMEDAGLPEPQLQVPLREDKTSGRLPISATGIGGWPYSTTAATTSSSPKSSAISGVTKHSRLPGGPLLCLARRIWLTASTGPSA